jgi:putative DNA primase/helicase
VDEAIRRRLNLVPFTVTIPPDERDADLLDKLKAEWPGILRWLIDGCLEWQARGLAPPSVVLTATNEYLQAEDAISNWIRERCKDVGYGGTESSVLYADWCTWAKTAGEESGSQKRFSQALESKGYVRDPKARHATFLGIALDLPKSWTEPDDDRA